ncbi:MAG: Holo-[acyl-carrier-protein] synthase [Synergistales bacterium 53_16]|jgi:holo-[acyl-carrier protein] synthase|nr:MAG: Holo-[acyl-carrier-protein] synthase [Synergistales bacterium 53_16]KUL04549.1 MAG: Holo-[acyl-carrier-protein] synthase [Synergistales bacterium 54_9]MDK2845741.1 holo-[acyl-carrier protein] synthase [Synergistales bacterium]MDN5336740.1 holo-[acyl-carrier protein] synthase [Synergistales bacterium]
MYNVSRFTKDIPSLGAHMITGVGIDLCRISRIAECLSRPGFEEKVFAERERIYAKNMKNPAQHFAASFAAKEAFAKAGGWGIGKVGLKNVWLERTPTGPVIFLEDPARLLVESTGAKKVHVSLSHDGDNVVAIVLLEGGSQNVSL